MIVHTMSPAEVVAEALKDLPAVWNKLKAPITRLQRRSRVDPRMREKEQLLTYRSPQGNNWIIVMRPMKKVFTVALFVYYRGGDQKLRAARICGEGLSFHFSAHVLDQYFARFNRAQGQLERLKEFALENMDFGVESLDGANEIRVGARHGYITGCWIERGKVIQLTTFVDHGKLFPEQIEQMERLDEARYESFVTAHRPGPEPSLPWQRPFVPGFRR